MLKTILEKNLEFLIKLNIQLPEKPPILILNIKPREMKTYVHNLTSTRVVVLGIYYFITSYYKLSCLKQNNYYWTVFMSQEPKHILAGLLLTVSPECD